MATVLFWEKPGCVNNTKQKKLLREAGHEVLAHDLLTEAWQAERLRGFFGQLPVAAWFNGSAPAIKQGLVQPEALDEKAALALMLDDPLLIRRPLMQVGARCEAGFDPARVDAWIGLTPQTDKQQDLETCPRTLAGDAP
jgi:nitrogenase-associated protein